MTIVFPGDDPHVTIEKARRIADDLARLVNHPAPSTADLAGAPLLTGFIPVARAVLALQGCVCGHPQIVDGHLAMTTEIFALDLQANWARSWTRFYRLSRSNEERRGRAE